MSMDKRRTKGGTRVGGRVKVVGENGLRTKDAQDVETTAESPRDGAGWCGDGMRTRGTRADGHVGGCNDKRKVPVDVEMGVKLNENGAWDRGNVCMELGLWGTRFLFLLNWTNERRGRKLKLLL